MSFSMNVKQELSQISDLKNKEAVKFELIGYLISSNIKLENGYIRYSTENEYNINRYNKLLTNLKIDYDINIQGKVFNIICKKIESIEQIYYEDNDIFLIESIDEKYVKNLVRGSFMGSGSINEPEKNYHFEITINTRQNAEKILKILENVSIKSKILERKRGYSIYIKEAESISNILAFMGANNAVLKFEELRIVKDMKNNVNRIVNCETANINKTINAATFQIEAIKKIIESGNFDKLSENLKEMAELRISNPDATLVELGEMLKKPIGKSGVNHRLKKLIEMSENL